MFINIIQQVPTNMKKKILSSEQCATKINKITEVKCRTNFSQKTVYPTKKKKMKQIRELDNMKILAKRKKKRHS